jgi:hypothetical protein
VGSTGFEPVCFYDSCLEGFATGVVFFYESMWEECSVLFIEPEVYDSPFTVTVFTDVSGPEEACSTLSSYAQCYHSDNNFRLPDSMTNKWIIVYESNSAAQVSVSPG